MPTNTGTVAVVLDPEFGERLRTLAQQCEVWAVGSTLNREVAKRYWSELTTPSNSSLTIFDWSPGESASETVLRMLDMIDMHHPGCTRFEFIGARADPRMSEELARLGYTELSLVERGFNATKPAP